MCENIRRGAREEGRHQRGSEEKQLIELEHFHIQLSELRFLFL